MAFQKKQRIHSHDGRPQGSKLEQREAKVKHLKELNTPESRAVLKKMNDKVYRGSRTNLSDWFNPSINAKGKQTRRK